MDAETGADAPGGAVRGGELSRRSPPSETLATVVGLGASQEINRSSSDGGRARRTADDRGTRYASFDGAQRAQRDMCKLREWCKSLKSFCTRAAQRFLPAKELSLVDVNTSRTNLRKAWHGSWMTSDTVKRKMPLKPATLSVFSRLERLAKLLGGIPVWEVFPDSGAAQAGVRFGDIILRVNGTKTPTFELFLEAGEKHLDRLEFEVFRNGKLLRLQTDAKAMPAPSPH